MNNDLFIYDTERLNSIAPDDVQQQGLAYFTEHRVLGLDKQNSTLLAKVQDDQNPDCQEVELTQNSSNKLLMRCTCNPPPNEACKHIIATLHGYAAYMERYQKFIVETAADAIQDCIKKGATEIRVKLISGNVGFGVWQATSTNAATRGIESYQVHIRSLKQRLNYCTCPDLNRHRLGTCKHIESVLYYAQNKPDYNSLLEAGSPVSFVYMAWHNNQPVIRLHACADISDDLAAVCAEFFDDSKTFIGHLPGDFFRYAERVFGRDDFHIGEDVQNYAQQCLKDDAYRVRCEHISQEVKQTNGALPGIKLKLLPFQIEGAAFLASRGRALLADDMGLGKTLQSIAAASWLINSAHVKKVLVVCPGSLKYQWVREIKKSSTYSVQLIQGSAEQRLQQYQSDVSFSIIPHEMAIRDLHLIGDQLKPDLIILDEPQRTKNWRFRLAAKIKLIPCPYVFILGSLILEKRLDDLYSLMQVIDVRILDPLWRYLLDYEITDAKGKMMGYRDLEQLHQRVSPVLLRRERHQVITQLLDKTEVRLEVPLDKTQRDLHDIALAGARQLAHIAGRRPLTPGEQYRFMASLQQARMACNAAGLIDKETQGSPKLHELSQLLEELCLNGKHKAVVFSQWTAMIEMAAASIQPLGLVSACLHGSTDSDVRAEQLDSFKKDDGLQLLFVTDAASVGLNLFSATVLIHLDMPWNPAVLEQRIAHVYKSGQKKPVHIFTLVAEDAYEQQVARLVRSKNELFNNIICTEATDDAVAVSKKVQQTLMDALTGNTANADRLPANEWGGDTTQLLQSVEPSQSEESLKFQQLLEKIQSAFKYRLQQVMGSTAGVLVVVNSGNCTDEVIAQQLSDVTTPVAVIDNNALLGLKRLSDLVTLTQLPVLYEGRIQAIENPLLEMAKAKLYSASLLLAQKSKAGVLDLLSSALLLHTAAVAGQFQPPTIDTAAVWLHNEILPQQLITQEQAAVLLRVLSLQQSQDVPISLIEQALVDAQAFCSVFSGAS